MKSHTKKNHDRRLFTLGLILSSCLHLFTLGAFVWVGGEVQTTLFNMERVKQ